jgi:hypothetical protein
MTVLRPNPYLLIRNELSRVQQTALLLIPRATKLYIMVIFEMESLGTHISRSTFFPMERFDTACLIWSHTGIWYGNSDMISDMIYKIFGRR